MPLLRCPHHQPDGPPDHTGVPHGPLPRLLTDLQRAHRHTLQSPAQVPTDIAVLVVPGRLQDKLSLRNVAEMVLTRDFTFTHETAPAWEWTRPRGSLPAR